MSWQTEMVTMTRVFINDFTQPFTYTDERLEELLVVAAQLVSTELDFTQPFAADLENMQIVPDPTDRYSVPPTRDDSFLNLVCMKAACITDRSETKTAANQAVDVRDGTSQVNLRWAAVARLALLDKSWCKAFEDEKLAYMINRTHVAGAAIMGPFRVWAYEGIPWQFDQRLTYPSDTPGMF